MPLTTYSAFQLFRELRVDLDSTDTAIAKRSRNYLQEQLLTVSRADFSLPRLTGRWENFGSFARKTKIRPLDDIDTMAVLDAQGTRLGQRGAYSIYLEVTDRASPLAGYTDALGYVSSIRILHYRTEKVC